MPPPAPHPEGTTVNIVLWIIAGLLAAAFAAAGLMKLTKTRAELAESGQGWTEDFSDPQVKTIGVLEVLAAIGLVLPAALGVATVLTPLAAAGLVLLMVGAAVVHLRRSEPSMVVVNLVLGALAAFVAVMRFGPHAF
jgi:uncharacterized membrane protein YphA (DoxX/SURF4 family)